MKRVLPLLVGIVIGVAAFYFYTILATEAIDKKGNSICNDYSSTPPNLMNRQDVLDMVKNYYNNQYAALHDPTSSTKLKGLPTNCPVDSRAVFFNLDTLKKLIYFVEKASKGYSPAEKQNLGLNIYFASYPDQFKKMHNGYDYTNRHTLIFIPSLFNNTTMQAGDLNLLPNLSGATSSPSRIDSTFFNGPSSLFMIAVGVGKTVSGGSGTSSGMATQNNGTGTPPPPPPPNTGNVLLDITDPH